MDGRQKTAISSIGWVEDSDRFFTALDRLPRFEIRFGRLRKTNSNPPFEQKGVDVLLSVDLVRLSSSNKIDKAILVSGDSDFVPAVRVAKDEGVIVELFYSKGQNLSRELYQICDDRFDITKDMIDKCTLKQCGRTASRSHSSTASSD
jgi:uncharacterized LabA/DUF88 family protein